MTGEEWARYLGYKSWADMWGLRDVVVIVSIGDEYKARYCGFATVEMWRRAVSE